MGEGDRARNQDRADDRVVVLVMMGREEGDKKNKTNRDIRGREKELAWDPRCSP